MVTAPHPQRSEVGQLGQSAIRQAPLINDACGRRQHDWPFPTAGVIDRAGVRAAVRSQGSVTLVVVDGEIDAGNCGQLARILGQIVGVTSPLVLDLSGVQFMAARGFDELITFGLKRDQADLPWALANGPGLRPLLRVFAEHQLPIFPSVAAAIEHSEAVQSHGCMAPQDIDSSYALSCTKGGAGEPA